MIIRHLSRALAVGILALALVGCAADDPIEVTVVTQEVDADAAAEAAADPDVELDCLGNPAADPATFPPEPGVDIVRPDDKIIDLRGQARVEVSIRGNQFETRWFRVDPCTEIVFTNNGVNPHNVIPIADGAFPEIDRDALDESPQALVVAAPGNYPFYCSLHGTKTFRGQTGYLVVGDD
jgi:plastocyanin